MPANFVIPAGVLCGGRAFGHRLSTAPQIAMDAAPPRISGLPVPGGGTTDDDADGVLSKLKEYLTGILSADDMANVEAILSGGEANSDPAVAMDALRRADALALQARQMRARATQRTAADVERFKQMFPNAGRLKLR